MKNPFNRHVFPTLARKLSAYLKDGQRLPIPVDADGRPISLLPSEIRNPDLSDKEREIIAAIYARSAQCLHQGNFRAAYDWDAVVASVAQELGCTEDLDVTRLVEEGCKLGLIATYPGAVETLQELAEGGAKLVALSNGFTCYQRPVLEALQIYQYFSAVVSPEEAGHAKPDPRLFHAACAAVGAPDGTPTFHVGDSLICDVGGARSAGFRALWVRRELPADVSHIAPAERPLLPVVREQMSHAAEHEFCSNVYHFTMEQLVPDAVVMHMDEVPATIWQMASSATSFSNPA